MIKAHPFVVITVKGDMFHFYDTYADCTLTFRLFNVCLMIPHFLTCALSTVTQQLLTEQLMFQSSVTHSDKSAIYPLQPT